MDDPVVLCAVIALIIYSVSLHELAHAWVATWCGDPTPGKHGRLTWNPLAQLDPWTSFLMPLITYLLIQMPFGYAYCPTNPSFYRRPLRDKALVAIAGPITNILICGFFVGLLHIPQVAPNESYNQKIFFFVSYYNLYLAVFNMIPIHPLDGYSVFRVFLPGSLRRSLDQFERSDFRMGGMLAILIGSFLMPYIFPPVARLYSGLLP